MDEWISRSSKLGEYPFKEAGAFAEAILRFGTRGTTVGGASSYMNDTCNQRAEVAFQQFSIQDIDDEAAKEDKGLQLLKGIHQQQALDVDPQSQSGSGAGGEGSARWQQRMRRQLLQTSSDSPRARRRPLVAEASFATRKVRRSALQARNQEYVECLEEHKELLMGAWSREKHRSMGKVRFVSTAAGFGAQEYQGGGGPYVGAGDLPGAASTSMVTTDPEAVSSFSDGNFIVHSKRFADRVSAPSTSCPQVTNSSFPLRDEEGHIVRYAPPIDVFSQNEGVYLVSDEGACDMNAMECKHRLFPVRLPGVSDADSASASAPCFKRHLAPFTKKGIKNRGLEILAGGADEAGLPVN